MVTKYRNSAKSEKAMAVGGFAFGVFRPVAGHLQNLGAERARRKMTRTVENRQSAESQKAIKAKKRDGTGTEVFLVKGGLVLPDD